MTSTLLPISLQNSLQDIIEQSNLRGASVRAILLSTTEGVPLGRVVAAVHQLNQPETDGSSSSSSSSSSSMNEDVLASIESVWAPASKQFPVLGLDKVRQVTAIYDHGSLIHIYQPPMVITILCGPHSNLGAVRATAIPLLKHALGPLSQELVNSLHPDHTAAAVTDINNNHSTNNSIPLTSYYG